MAGHGIEELFPKGRTLRGFGGGLEPEAADVSRGRCHERPLVVDAVLCDAPSSLVGGMVEHADAPTDDHVDLGGVCLQEAEDHGYWSMPWTSSEGDTPPEFPESPGTRYSEAVSVESSPASESTFSSSSLSSDAEHSGRATPSIWDFPVAAAPAPREPSPSTVGAVADDLWQSTAGQIPELNFGLLRTSRKRQMFHTGVSSSFGSGVSKPVRKKRRQGVAKGVITAIASVVLVVSLAACFWPPRGNTADGPASSATLQPRCGAIPHALDGPCPRGGNSSQECVFACEAGYRRQPPDGRVMCGAGGTFRSASGSEHTAAACVACVPGATFSTDGRSCTPCMSCAGDPLRACTRTSDSLCSPEVDIEMCAQFADGLHVPCSKHGTCRGRKCVCAGKDADPGEACETTDPCFETGVECQHGFCHEAINNPLEALLRFLGSLFTPCVCEGGYHGQHCEQFQDPCWNVHCGAVVGGHGTCKPGVCASPGNCEEPGVGTCQCEEGWYGHNCLDTDPRCGTPEGAPGCATPLPCSADGLLCQNGGVCNDFEHWLDLGFCRCPPGFTGTACEHELSSLLDPTPPPKA